MEDKMVASVIFSFRIIIISLMLIITVNSCTRKGKLEMQSRFKVETDLDSLKYIELPGLSKAKWMIVDIGTKKSRLSIGPTDYELYLYSDNLPDAIKDSLLNNLNILDEFEGVPVNKEIYTALGGRLECIKNLDEEQYLFCGKVFDASKVLRHMNYGVLVVCDSALFIRANTF